MKADKGSTHIMRSVSEFSKIVMMLTAFEMLLDLPQNEKRCNFRRQICNLVDPLLDEWAKEFHDLRSAIVHGGLIKVDRLWYKSDKNNKSHLQIADRVFRVVVKRKLCEKGFYEWDITDDVLEVIMKENLEGVKN